MTSSSSAPIIPPPPSSSSSPPSQSQLQTITTPPDQSNDPEAIIHVVALGVTPLALLGLCLPPRRLDTRSVMLGAVALWGTNRLTYDYTGKSSVQRFSSRMGLLAGTELPEKAKATQARLREDKERREKLRALREEMIRSGAVTAKGEGLVGWSDEQKRTLLEAYEKQRREGQQGGQTPPVEGGGKTEQNLIGKIWMGDASPDWKEKREQKEREALQEGGGGYWGLITDQIAEVWNGGKKDEGNAPKEKTDGDAKGR